MAEQHPDEIVPAVPEEAAPAAADPAPPAAEEPAPAEAPPAAASDGLKADLAAERKKRQAIEEELKALRDGSLSESESLRRRAEAAENELATLRLDNLKHAAASKAGLPADAVKRLQGSTAEELEADAKELAKLLKPRTSTTNDGAAKAATAPKDANTAIRQALGLI